MGCSGGGVKIKRGVDLSILYGTCPRVLIQLVEEQYLVIPVNKRNAEHIFSRFIDILISVIGQLFNRTDVAYSFRSRL